MIEIIFRGKRKDNGQWSYGDLIQLLGEQGQGRKFIVDNRFGACIDSDGSFVNTEAPFVNEFEPHTVEKYTGRKDKGGIDLYEVVGSCETIKLLTKQITDEVSISAVAIVERDRYRHTLEYALKLIDNNHYGMAKNYIVNALGREGADTE